MSRLTALWLLLWSEKYFFVCLCYSSSLKGLAHEDLTHYCTRWQKRVRMYVSPKSPSSKMHDSEWQKRQCCFRRIFNKQFVGKKPHWKPRIHDREVLKTVMVIIVLYTLKSYNRVNTLCKSCFYVFKYIGQTSFTTLRLCLCFEQTDFWQLQVIFIIIIII